jgi:hypothetical protein
LRVIESQCMTSCNGGRQRIQIFLQGPIIYYDWCYRYQSPTQLSWIIHPLARATSLALLLLPVPPWLTHSLACSGALRAAASFSISARRPIRNTCSLTRPQPATW